MGKILADYLSDEPATRPLDQFRRPPFLPSSRTSILDQTYPKHSGESIYYTHSLSPGFLFQDHVPSGPQNRLRFHRRSSASWDAVQDDAVEEGFPVPSDELVGDVPQAPSQSVPDSTRPPPT